MNLEQKTFLFSLLDYVPLGIVVLNEDFEILSWNHTIAQWSAIMTKEAEGKNLFDIFPHLKSLKYVERFNHVFDGAPPAFFSSKIHKHLIPCPLEEKKFRVQNCTFSKIPMRDENLKKLALLSIQDVTDLNKNILEIKKASKLKEEFFSVCSHDLRSPLNAVIGMSDVLMEDDVTQEEIKEYSEVIHSSGLMMLDIINNLLDLGKVGQVNRKELTDVSLSEVLKTSYDVHKYLADKKNIKFDLEIKNENLKVLAHENELVRALNNIISNAIKFTQDGGLVEITLNSSNGHLLLSVKDNGIGMSDDQLRHLFKKYNKGQRLGTSGEIGTGLGLSITNQLIKSFEGSLEVKSSIGDGSEFIVKIPLSN